MRIERTVEGKHTEARSRFFAIVFPARATEEIEAVVRARKGEIRKANHHCWACRFIDRAGVLVERSKDDGEVGHPGRVLLEILRKHDLEGGLIVSRVFGGVKLGVGGVARAFRAAGEEVVALYLGAAPPAAPRKP